jgi:hypothetical protein
MNEFISTKRQRMERSLRFLKTRYRSYKRQSRALHFGRNEKACTALSRDDKEGRAV